LDGKAADPEVISALLQSVTYENLRVLPCAEALQNPTALAGSEVLERTLQTLEGMADIVLIDTPAIFTGGAALELSRRADGVLFIVDCGAASIGKTSWAKQLLENVNATIVGMILNRSRQPVEALLRERSALKAACRP
jgi:MinD-like ATPase involved in chromosome partitioning or flagellar assembly